jgi:biopolymer transport protein ExbD
MTMRDRLQRQTGIDAEISTSSTADIAFLLIVFFMVTAVFAATKGLGFDLPSGRIPDTLDGQDSVFIEILGDGTMRVDCRPMGTEELLDHLEPMLTRNPDKPVIVYPHRGALYRHLVDIYDALLKAERRMPQPKVQISTPEVIEDYVAIFGVDPFADHCNG